MDRLVEMRTFVEVVDRGSMAAAADHLDVSPQLIGRRMTQLETRLRTTLLLRNTRKSALTETGAIFYDRAVEILRRVGEAESAVAAAADQIRGELVISAPRAFGGFGLMPFVVAYLRTHPDVSARVLLSDHFADLIGERVDAAIRIGKLPDSTLIARRLPDYHLALFASPGYLRGRGTPAGPDDLALHECLLYEYQDGRLLDRWRLTGPEGSTEVRVRGRLVTNDGRGAVDAAKSDQGIIVYDPLLLMREEQNGELVRLLPDHAGPSREMHLVYPASTAMRPALRAFIDAVTEEFRR